ncbi:MAG: hypothetical protein ACK48B_22205 [Dolichospermum sp.]
MNDETLVVRASCPLNMYLITPGSAVIKASLYNYINNNISGQDARTTIYFYN